ncbi:MAG: GEVED domain-containing protein, partial [bacterium]
LGMPCQKARWGTNIDLAWCNTTNPVETVYINVLMDWNQDGWWNEGWAGCAPHGTYEHVVKNFHVPEGTGKLGDHEISRFFSGDNHGYVWVRFSITNEEVELNVADHWNGSGIFSDGETEDYLLFFNDGDAREFGDAPDSALAYPATGQTGYFPTCKKSWGWDSPGYISHTVYGDHGVRLGRQNSIITHELNGNHGFCSCTEFHHFNKDIDNGLRKVKAYTITGPEGSETIGDDYFWDPTPALASLGTNIDLAWCNTTNPVETVSINGVMDWNQDGRWGGSISCSDSTLCEEHVLKNLEIDIGGSQESIAGFMSSSEREFTIGPNSGYVWARFTITKEPVELPWVGTGNFEDGETEDYLVYITSYMPPMDYGDAMPPFNTLLQEDGARHVIDSGVYLGSGVSSDEDGRPDSLAAGDDDDGITFESPWMIGDTGIIVVTHSVAGYLGIWYAPCDSQGSVSPLQAKMKLGEMNGNSQSDTLFITVDNSKFTWGDYMLRFRFSTDSSFSHYGLAPDGEVEDYMITISPSTEVETGNSQVIPREYVLKQNVPNPFNPETMIEYNLPVRSRIRLVIFDVLGHQIREWEIASQEAGSHTIVWDGRDRNNTQVAAGIYIYHIEAISIGSDDKPFQATQKMIFLK